MERQSVHGDSGWWSYSADTSSSGHVNLDGALHIALREQSPDYGLAHSL